jgi:hypothetical protein
MVLYNSILDDIKIVPACPQNSRQQWPKHVLKWILPQWRSRGRWMMGMFDVM